MPGSHYFNELSERGRRMANARWRQDRERREREAKAAAADPDFEILYPRKVGEHIGTLEWHEPDGNIRRRVVRQGPRKNQILIDGVSQPHGWSWLLSRLRHHLSTLTR